MRDAVTRKRRAIAGLMLCATACLAAPVAQSAPSVQVGFSPEGSAQQQVLAVINGAEHSIRLMGYSFTSPPVVRALMAAQQRGVDVKAVLDDKANRNRAGVRADEHVFPPDRPAAR